MVVNKPRERDIVAGLDIGASKAACFIASCAGDDEHGPEVIGVGCYGGDVAARAFNVADTEHRIRRAVDAAERMAGQRVSKVSVAVPGRYLHVRRLGVEMEIVDGVVTQDDIDECVRVGAENAVGPDYRLLEATPTAFRLDHEVVVEDPIGQMASMLTVEVLVACARTSMIDNMAAMVERCGVTASSFAPRPLASAESCLMEDERVLGVLMLDLGASTTEYAVYRDGAPILLGGVALGGANITKDVAKIFGAPLKDAERIKALHGSALVGPGDEHRFIDFPQLAEDDEPARASKADLSAVITPRLEEIFDLVAERLSEGEGSLDHLRRVVLTGGGALLLGAREVAEQRFGLKARIGRPTALVGAPEVGAAPGFAACAGLVRRANRRKTHFSLGANDQSAHRFVNPAFWGGVEAWLRAKF